ncbi:AMMECR1 domain-containing protein [Patescibacteria group bacterium]|nr:AMMECR1 domain-containing protein [Patescibacteria group bacterium]
MHQLVELAKLAVETFVREGKIISAPEDLPAEFFKRKAGTFVTIEKELQGVPRGERKWALRGCIGTYLPIRANITEETIRNAIAVATEDYRFGPIKKGELPYLSYAVYILSEPELVKNIQELNPKKYGIIINTVPISPSGDVVFNGHLVPKRGLLLPDLEGIDTIEKQISIACQKGGIDPQREKILIYKFTVEKYQ